MIYFCQKILTLVLFLHKYVTILVLLIELNRESCLNQERTRRCDPSFFYFEKGTSLTLCVPLLINGKAVKRGGEVRRPAGISISHRGMWHYIADLEDKKG